MAKPQSPSQARRAEKQKKNPQRNQAAGVRRAQDLRIGQSFGTHKGETVFIRSLHELCQLNREPHVHIVTTHGVHCRGFLEPVG